MKKKIGLSNLNETLGFSNIKMKMEIITQGFQYKKTLLDEDILCSKIVENVENLVCCSEKTVMGNDQTLPILHAACARSGFVPPDNATEKFEK